VPLPTGEQIRLGRDETCDIVVDRNGVSRLHLVFDVSATAVVVADFGSTYGSAVRRPDSNWQGLVARQREALEAGCELRLAEPEAVTMTLVPVLR